MFTLREKQMEVFVLIELKKFEDRVLEHVREFFPRKIENLSEENIREGIQYGIKRAAVYGIVAERDVLKYIDLAVVLGRDFDIDTRIAWASEILKTSNSSGAKIESLLKAANDHLK
jgi:hypothetical protein